MFSVERAAVTEGLLVIGKPLENLPQVLNYDQVPNLLMTTWSL